MGGESKKTTFQLVLIKPTHYDDDGYPITWLRSHIPSNTLAALYGLGEDCRQRQALGADVDIVIKPFDETNIRVRPDKIIADFKRSGGKFSAKMSCDGDMKGEGEVEGNYASNGEAYDGKWKFAGTETGHGKPHDVKMSSTFSGKFVSSDCGDTKPFDY